MSNKETTSSCGAVNMLKKLRQSQEQDVEINSTEKKAQSRLDMYIAKGKPTIERSTKKDKETIPKDLETVLKTTNHKNAIYEVDTLRIHRWSGKDRPENELGDIDELAKSFINIGQQVPCIVRPYPAHPGEYELIVGECRWHAAKKANRHLLVIIQEMDDRMAALIQAVENEKRTDLSEFAKGMSYAKKIESGVLAQKDLIEILGIRKQQVSRLLSFRKIPPILFDAIGDFRKVSSRTAEELCRLAAKGPEQINILVKIAKKISTGKYGEKRIKNEIERSMCSQQVKKQTNKKVYNIDGRHLFTWRLDNNLSPSIHFPKDIIKLVQNETINLDEITEEFKGCLARKLANLIEESPRGD